MDIQKTKNTLEIDYEYDKLNNIGQFALTYRKDNKTVKVNENDNVSIYYFKEGKGDLHLVSNPKIVGGEVKFDQTSMGDSLSSGVYDIYSTVNGEIYPSQGYVKIKLETHVENGIQITVLTGPKGDTGETGQAGKDAPTFTNVNYQNGNLTFTLSDKSTISTPLTLPAGPKGDTGLTGQPGKDAPKIVSVLLNGNSLTFTLSDLTKYNVNLPLLKGEKGDPGQTGKDAPTITNVNYQGGNLIFTLSDDSTVSTPLVLPAGPKGDTGETGQAGKDAPTFTNVNYQNGNLIFTLSDKSTISTPLTLPTGPKGDTGLAGKDAPKIDSVSLNGSVLTFNLSDSTNYAITLPLLKGDAGQAGKDAPTITNVNYQGGNLIFTLSDSSTISTPLTLPTGPKGDPGEKGNDGMSAYEIAKKDGFSGSEQEWLASLKGEQGPAGPAGQGGSGSKLKDVFYDGMVRHKAIFENDDGSLIESNIFSDPMLPANPKNLTVVSLHKDTQPQNIKPQTLKAGLTDTTIHVPYIMHKETPTSSSNNYDSLDIHLDTANLLDKKTGVQYKDVEDLTTFANFEWLAEKVKLSPDKHTLYVQIRPVASGDILPKLNFFEKWHENYANDNTVVDFYENNYSVPNLTGSNTDFPLALPSNVNLIFDRVEKIAFINENFSPSIVNYMILYNSTTSPAFNIDYEEQTVPTDSWLNINKYFTVSLNS